MHNFTCWLAWPIDHLSQRCNSAVCLMQVDAIFKADGTLTAAQAAIRFCHG